LEEECEEHVYNGCPKCGAGGDFDMVCMCDEEIGIDDEPELEGCPKCGGGGTFDMVCDCDLLANEALNDEFEEKVEIKPKINDKFDMNCEKPMFDGCPGCGAGASFEMVCYCQNR